jgi:hypothetical protein
MTPDVQKPLRIFCSYSHKDEEYANDLRDSLRGLERQGLIEWWHDREIVPGWEWEEAIDKHLRTADVILLLLSRAFMASDYVYEREIGVAVERHNRGEARVIPVIARPADWKWASFGKLQALPKDAKPIPGWQNPDDAWLDVTQGVRRAVEALLRERQERYRNAVEDAWVDKQMSDAEAEQLAALTRELRLSADVVADIERDIMGDIKEAIIEHQEVAAREEERNRQRETHEQDKTSAALMNDAREPQHAVLDEYEDWISQQIDAGLDRDPDEYAPIRVSARRRTLRVLERLDRDHKKDLLELLWEQQLIRREEGIVDGRKREAYVVGLSGADLREANLRYITLEGAALDGANLENADLREAKLSGIDLGGAYLSGADLSGAYLSNASLREVKLQRKDELNLRGADLSGADLSGADLTDANVTEEQLATCKSLQGATMPDGTVHD